MTPTEKYVPSPEEKIFTWPLDMSLATFTSGNGFGPRRIAGTPPGVFEEHLGWDIGAPEGTPVFAAADGLVDVSRPDGEGEEGGGNQVWIRHENWNLGYFHMRDTPLVSEGDTVKAGDIIGYVGATGNSGGFHLCWQLQLTRGGQALYMNPRQVMRDYGKES